MDEIQNRVAIVEKNGENYKIKTVTLMTEERIGQIITENESLRQQNDTLRQKDAYHLDVTMRNNAEIRIILDSLLRTGILQNNQINITAALKPMVRKIVDDYEEEKQIFIKLGKFQEYWSSFFKKMMGKIFVQLFNKE